MPESDHTVTDRIMRLEVLSEESDKRITRFEGEMRATIAELKLLIHSEQQELGSEIRDVGGALILLSIIVALMGFICWRVWPYIAHAGMH